MVDTSTDGNINIYPELYNGMQFRLNGINIIQFVKEK